MPRIEIIGSFDLALFCQLPLRRIACRRRRDVYGISDRPTARVEITATLESLALSTWLRFVSGPSPNSAPRHVTTRSDGDWRADLCCLRLIALRPIALVCHFGFVLPGFVLHGAGFVLRGFVLPNGFVLPKSCDAPTCHHLTKNQYGAKASFSKPRINESER
jgi:hypothetical protein